MKQKVIEWLKRYLPAEIISIIATLVAAWITDALTHNGISVALASTWAGNVGYFGYILIADVLESKATLRAENQNYSFKDFVKNLRTLLVEFGIAELFDSLLIRPALMYYCPIWLGNLSLGIIVGKLAADVTFYVPAIISYEMNKKYLEKREQ